MNSDSLTVQRLVQALLEMDSHLERGQPMPDDAPKPVWCSVFCAGLQSPAGECCGVCGVLSETARTALDRAFQA